MDLELPVQSVPITTKVASSISRLRQGVLNTTLCDKVCQWLATGWWFSMGTLVNSSTNKTDCHDITKILMKVALNTINQPNCLFWLDRLNLWKKLLQADQIFTSWYPWKQIICVWDMRFEIWSFRYDVPLYYLL